MDRGTASDNVMGRNGDIYLGNLHDILAGGNNLLALKDDEALGLAQLLKGSSGYASIFGKLLETPAVQGTRKGE